MQIHQNLHFFIAYEDVAYHQTILYTIGQLNSEEAEMENKPLSWFEKAFIIVKTGVGLYVVFTILVFLILTLLLDIFSLKGIWLIIGYAGVLAVGLYVNYVVLNMLMIDKFGPADPLDLYINKANNNQR